MTLLGFIIAGLVEVGYDYVKNMDEIVRKNKYSIQRNTQKMESIDIRLKEIEGDTKYMVTRPSFNDYIMRKDTEYHTQLRFNDKISREVGELNAKSDLFERFLYELNDYELNNQKAIRYDSTRSRSSSRRD